MGTTDSFSYRGGRKPAAFADGHFYSPVVDVDEIGAQQAAIWPADPTILGIDFNPDSHRRILREAFPRFIREYDYPEVLEDTPELDRFYTRNSQFSWLDARALFVLLRAWRPRRIIEIGSGYSSLLMTDVNRRFLDGATHITCIEPYPRPFLRRSQAGIAHLIEQKVQDVPLGEFGRLGAGDVLFIDSSHVAKTGSDVNQICFEIIPRLAPGVRIHIHDIFLPHEYPVDWVLNDNRSWNEQYIVRALLMYTTAFKVLFGSAYAYHAFPDLVRDALALPGGAAFAGGSLWLEKCA
jgi:predicted O-methyltransferase YrrM